MKSIVTILNSGSQLDKYEARINDIAVATIRKVENLIEVQPLDIVIAHDPMGAIPETGSGGYARNANLLWISLDANDKDFSEKLEKDIAGTIAHEMHHCARMATVGYGETFWDSLITEGLADHFDEEVIGTGPKPWSIALDEECIKKWSKASRDIWDSVEYDHASWFFGDDKIPRWTGYSLGYHFVKKWISETGRAASGLVNVPSPPRKSLNL